MNKGELRSRVRNLSGVRSPELKGDDEVDALVNEAYLELCGLRAWPFLYEEATAPVVALEQVVDLPTPMRELTGVLLGGERLAALTVPYVDTEGSEPAEPVVYAPLDDRRIILDPTPKADSTLTFRGLKSVQPLDLDGDVPLFDLEFHPGIAYAAASRLLAEEGDDSGRSDAYLREASGFLDRMVIRYDQSKDRRLVQMGGAANRRRRQVW